MANIKGFKEIKHTVCLDDHHGEEMRVTMFIPGVNSGAYSPRLVLKVWIKRKIFGFFRKTVFGMMHLSINDVIELRDECDRIIEVAKKQGRIKDND